jgi:uncharacterized protein (UPF0216 family)
MNTENRLYKHIFSYAQRTLINFMDLVSERILLREAPEHDLELITMKGNKIFIPLDEIRKLKQEIPMYLHGKTRLPLQLVVVKGNPVEAEIWGDEWDARIIQYILQKRLVWDARKRLSSYEIARLIHEFPSLIHMVLRASGDEERKV